MMFLTFIRESKLYLSSNKMKWFVIGNEAADLDSVVSSLVYSYYKQKKLGDSFAVMPICSIPKNKILLKKDVLQWCGTFGIDIAKEMLFLEDIKDLLYNNKSQDNLQISLVDHHKPLLEIMQNYIREVIDHRQIVHKFPDGQLQLQNTELVGSCSTLIGSYIIEETELEDKIILLTMLRGSILLDTDCLAKNNGRTTNIDENMVKSIENLTGLTLCSRLEVYNMLSQAKSDISGFTVAMMVERDLKIFQFLWNNIIIKMAIPTLINIDVEDLLAISDIEIQLTAILKDLNTNIIIGLTSGSSLHKRRGYLIFSNNIELNNRIYEYLMMPEHGLELKVVVLRDYIKGFYQDNSLISRKVFIPIIEKFFKIENQFQEQLNNSNVEGNQSILRFTKTDDSEVSVEIDEIFENEGAPYTLSTPLRSYSGSPDNRNSDMALPSLNNRHTLQLVDQKWKKLHAEMDEETVISDYVQETEKNDNDDVSSAFTPENSDDESLSEDNCDSYQDNIGPLPSLKHSLSAEKIQFRHLKINEQKNYDSLSKSETSLINDGNISTMPLCESRSNKFSNFNEENFHDTEFNSLIEKVDKKRKKFYSSNINAIACAVVKDVINKSQNIISDEIDFELVLNDWSDNCSDEEKKQIFECVNSNDFTKLASLLTSSLIRDCLKSPSLEIYKSDVKNNYIDQNIELSDTKSSSPIKQLLDGNDTDSMGSLEAMLSNLENNYEGCHMGNIIDEKNQSALASSVNSSSAYVVENICFNLYRRISSNQVDYSEDEKELLTTAGDWLPKEGVIYSDTEHDDCSESHSSENIEEEDNGISDGNVFQDEQLCVTILKSSNLKE